MVLERTSKRQFILPFFRICNLNASFTDINEHRLAPAVACALGLVLRLQALVGNTQLLLERAHITRDRRQVKSAIAPQCVREALTFESSESIEWGYVSLLRLSEAPLMRGGLMRVWRTEVRISMKNGVKSKRHRGKRAVCQMSVIVPSAMDSKPSYSKEARIQCIM